MRSFANIFGVKRKIVRENLKTAGQITAPTLVVWGKEDQIIPVEEAHTSVKMLPDARLHIIENCGHWPQIECAEEFNEVVLSFLGDQVA